MRILVFIHILGAILFLGNIISAALWKTLAEVRGNLPEIYSAARNVMLADWVFTLPGIVMLLASGHIMMTRMGLSLMHLSWLSLAYGMFIISGLLWLIVLIPKQRAMIRYAKDALSTGRLSADYHQASRIWNMFGVISVILPLVILYLMVVKPL